jgi:3-oxoacyl-(acyl-carrier-protein) synthase
VSKAFVTGIGIISAIGYDAESVLKSLSDKKSGIGRINLIDSIYRDEIPAGEIQANNDQLRSLAETGNKFNSRTALLGLIAAKQAIAQAKLKGKMLAETAFISGTTVGGMDRTENFFKYFLKNKNGGRLREIAGHDCGAGTELIADHLGMGGFISTINTACSSSANAIMLAARLIKQGKITSALAGGVDCLTKFTLNGFNSLMILDREQCRPFDDNRNGLNLGEGSAFLVIESEDSVITGNKKVLAEIKGFGNACDAYHQTASSPDGNGAYLAMKQSLDTAGLNLNEIDYINTHGTGTKNNDLSEGIAIERLFGEHIPPCSSTKSFTGHTLGAAGAIEAVISILAIQNGCIFPNLNFSRQMQELKFTPATELILNRPIRYVMSNSFGFGGNNSSLIISGN